MGKDPPKKLRPFCFALLLLCMGFATIGRPSQYRSLNGVLLDMGAYNLVVGVLEIGVACGFLYLLLKRTSGKDR